MFVRRDENGICFIAIWVDDSLMIGDTKAIDKTIEELQNEGFSLKIEGALSDYLSCEIKIDREQKRGWIHQPHLIKKLEDRFGDMVKGILSHKTPGLPNHVIV